MDETSLTASQNGRYASRRNKKSRDSHDSIPSPKIRNSSLIPMPRNGRGVSSMSVEGDPYKLEDTV